MALRSIGRELIPISFIEYMLEIDIYKERCPQIVLNYMIIVYDLSVIWTIM
ncbi:MAG: hypothetical protein ACFFBZ_01680 [Promethearchaeota archaeon]